jgi:hypothetical protein
MVPEIFNQVTGNASSMAAAKGPKEVNPFKVCKL